MTATRRQVAARLVGSVLMAASAVVVPVALGAPAAHAATNGEWSVTPATPKGSGNDRQFIFLEVRPGQTVKDAVVVENDTKALKTFTVFPADAYNAPNTGAFSLTTVVDKPTDVGTWVKIDKTKVDVKPGKSVKVPFTVTVPRTATPGDHVGGIVALDSAVTVGGDNPNVRVDVQNAIGVRMYTRVAGPLTPSLTIEDYKLSVDPKATPFSDGSSTVTFTLKNTGNVRITPKAEVILTGLFGRKIDSIGPTTINEVLPGGSATLKTTVPDSTFIGPVHAQLKITSPEAGAGADATKWVIPWWLVVVVLVIVAGLVYWRRRKSGQGASGGSSGSGKRRRTDGPPSTTPPAPVGTGTPGGPAL